MAQLLIIQGNDPHRVRDLRARARRAFASLCRVGPLEELDAGPVAVGKFPRRHAPSTGIVRGVASSTWAAGAGTWFGEGGSPEDVLAALNETLGGEAAATDAALSRLDGPFVLAAGDAAAGEVAVVTDRIGTLHAYATSIDSTLLVSTSSLVLAALGRAPLDPVGCAEFLATGTIFEDRTAFREVRKLEPATLFRFAGGALRSRRRYWSVADVLERRPTPGTVAALAAALRAALRRVCRRFARPVVDLTGGLDSRALVAAMLDAGLPLATVVNGAPADADVVTAGAIATAFQLDHRHQSLPADWGTRWWELAKDSLALCDGECDALEYARVLEYHRRLAPCFDVSINGSGGELARGYWWELLFPFTGRRRRLDERRVAAARFATDGWSAGLLAGEAARGLVEHFAEVVRRAGRDLGAYPNTARMDSVYLTLRMQRWQGRIASATNRLWPNVSPFLFGPPLEIALAAPPRLRVRDRMARRLNEHLHPRLAALPLAPGYPALPLRFGTAHRFLPLAVDIARRARRRLLRRAPRPAPRSPLAQLLRHAEIRDLLDPGRMATRHLYRAAPLQRLLAALDRAAEPQVGRLLTLELAARAVKDFAG